MLRYTEIPKSECQKISVATVLLNSDNTEENYEGNRHNLALVYHEFIDMYVLLVKRHVVFETDHFVLLKKTKEESISMLEKSSLISIINEKMKIVGLKHNKGENRTHTYKQKNRNSNRNKNSNRKTLKRKYKNKK